ncbi:MAG: hypothetical protein U1E26_06405 [Coriobacteriia bacterium]|nr:hypothetical protein [Coriobacteriia bacterium]
MERRYGSPYRHWVSGFIFEVAIFAAYLIFLAGMSFGILRLAG